MNMFILSKLLLQETRSGEVPTWYQVFCEGHQGLDPNNPEQLCDEKAMERVVSVKIVYLYNGLQVI